jgi:hypothetical protein
LLKVESCETNAASVDCVAGLFCTGAGVLQPGGEPDIAAVYTNGEYSRNDRALQITSSRLVFDSATATADVWGEVVNIATVPLYSPWMTGSLANSQRAAVLQEVELAINYLEPGATTAFHLGFAIAEQDMQLTLQPTYEFADEVTNPLALNIRYLTVLSQEYHGAPVPEVVGQVRNATATWLVSCQVVVTFYNEAGQVIAFVRATAGSDGRPSLQEGVHNVVDAGETVSYRIPLSAPVTFASYRVQGQGTRL